MLIVFLEIVIRIFLSQEAVGAISSLKYMDCFLLRRKYFNPLLNQNASFVCLLSSYLISCEEVLN